MGDVQNIEQQYEQDLQIINEYRIRYRNQINAINQKYSNQVLRESIRRRCVIAGQRQFSQSQVDQENDRIATEEYQNDPTYNNATSDEERVVIISQIKNQIVIILQEDLILYSQPVQQSLERSTMSIIKSFLQKILKLGGTLSFGYLLLKVGYKLASYFSKMSLIGIAVTLVVIAGVALIYFKINPITALTNYIMS